MAPPADPDAWADLYDRALVLSRTRDPLRLDRAAEELIEADPSRPEGYRLRGEAALMRGDAKAAVPFGDEAVARAPTSDFDHYRLAAFLRFAGERARAEEHILRAIEGDPEYAEYWIERGWLAFVSEDKALAKTCAKRARELDPESVDGPYLEAHALPTETTGERRIALRAFDRLLERVPESDVVWFSIAKLRLEVGELEAAEKAARTALSLDPADDASRALLFRILKRRSLVYRILRFPGDAVMRGIGFIGDLPWVVYLPLGWLLTRFLVVLCFVGVGWVLLVLPILKLYEWLSTVDVGRRAREIPGRPRGRFDVIHWPRPLRTAIVLLVAAGLWTGAWYALQDATTRKWVAISVGAIFVLLLLLGLWVLIAERVKKKRAGVGARKLDALLRRSRSVSGNGRSESP